MKNCILASSFLFLFCITKIFGEGTPQLQPNATDRASIKLINTVPGVVSTGFARYNDTSKTKYKMYVHVCDLAEKVYMGFNLDAGTGFSDFDVKVVAIAPNGTIAFPLTTIPHSAGPGYIATKAEAIAGPNTLAAGGYNPFVFTPTQLGDYSIEFQIDQLPSSGTSGGRGNSYIHMFDITVANGTVAKPGRLWSTAWNLSVRNSSNAFNGSFYIYSSDQIVSKITSSGMVPQEFVFSANNTGVKSSNDPVDDRKSVTGNTTYPLYPVFLQNPDIQCYPTGSFGAVTAAPTLSGCPGNYCINVFVSAAGTATILLDLNGTIGYQAGTSDRILVANVSPSNRCVPWDGKDGLGNVVSASNVPATVSYESGIIHIPIFDVEENVNGFSVSYVRPSSSEPIGLFWDDSNISGGSTNILNPCLTNCHTWGNVIGNGRTINSWWVVADSTVSTTFSLTRLVDANRNKPGTGTANDSTVCASLKTIPLKGSFVGVPGIKWTAVPPASGTFANDASATTTYTLSAADATRPFIEIQIASAGDGCAAVTDKIRYTINPLPDVTANPKDPYSCVGASVTLTGGNSSTYTWDNGVQNGVPFTATLTRRYTVTGTDANGCSDTASTLVRVNTPPKDSLNVRGDTICSDPATTLPIVTIFNAQAGVTYTARLGSMTGAALGAATPNTNTAALAIPISRAPLAAATSNNSVLFTTTLIGCGTDSLNKRANVRINKLPNNTSPVTATGPVCVGGTSVVSIDNTQAGVTYTVFEENVRKGSVTSNGGTIQISVVMNNLGNRTIRVEASVAECAIVELLDKPVVVVNTGAKIDLVVRATSPICFGDTSILTIEKTETDVQYSVYHKSNLIASPKAGTGFDLSYELTNLPKGNDTLTIKAFTAGCGSVDLLSHPVVVVNGTPNDSALVVIGDTVCSTSDSAYVTLQNTMAHVRYQLVLNGSPIGTIKGSPIDNDTLVLSVPVRPRLQIGNNTFQITGTIGGCDTVIFGKEALIIVNKIPEEGDLTFIGDTICSNSDSAYVKVLNTELGVRYQAKMGTTLVGSAKTSQLKGSTVTLGIPRSVLLLGNNTLQMTGFLKGCGLTDFTKTVLVIVNQLPDSSLAVTDDTVCNTSSLANIKVIDTKAGESYLAFENGIAIGNPVLSAGGSVTLPLPIGAAAGQLNPATKVHVMKVSAFIEGCAEQKLLDSSFVIINQDPDTTLTVTETTPICLSDTATITVQTTSAEVRYSLVYQGGPIDQKQGTGSDLVFSVKPGTEGFHEYVIQTGIRGCDVHSLADRARIKVNKSPDPNLRISGQSPICYGATSTINVFGTDTVSSFEVWNTSSSVSASVKGNGGTISIVVNNLPKGLDTLFVKAFTPGCGWVTLADTLFIQVNGAPDNATVKVEGSSVCRGQNGFAVLDSTSSGVVYKLYINGGLTVLEIVGTGGPDTLIVPAVFLPGTQNALRFTANTGACEVADVVDRDTIYVLDDPGFRVTGDDLVCFHSTGDYATNGMPGALSYKWTAENAVLLTTDTLKSVTVQFDTVNAALHVVPVGNYGACENSKASFTIAVRPPISDMFEILGNDTVCTGQVDTIQIIRQKGVLSYQWLVPDLVDSLGLLVSDSASLPLVLRYPTAGLRVIKAVPFSECASAYGDTISFPVRVLGSPVAVANDMTVDRIGTLDPIILDGKGSTLTGTGLSDTISYLWSTNQSLRTQIANPTSLTNAALSTSSKETKVYLMVSQKGGYCPALDSAIITIHFDIDVPNVFSPNNDGTHDTWEIKNITTFYPNAVVEVFNKWGSLVWKSAPGYPEPWDGKRNGEEMPVATYYFILDKKAGEAKPMVSSVTIIR